MLFILVRNNEIEEMEEYIYFGRMVNMCRDMDAEILGMIKSERKAFATL